MNNLAGVQQAFLAATELEGDALLITSEANCRYVSGFPCSNRTVLLTQEATYFLTDFRYAEAARKAIPNMTVVDCKTENLSLQDLLKRHHVHTLLLEYEQLSYAQSVAYQKLCQAIGIEAVPEKGVDILLQEVRAVKLPWELERIQAAQKITDDAFAHILSALKEGVTEREIALELEFFMKKQGAEALAFDLIVVSGENGSLCHGVPGERRLQKGDFITMDIGAVVQGYHSDMTRTVALHHVTEKQREVYQTVLQAQTKAIQAVKAGIPCCDVDAVARNIIDAKYKGAFGHGTGHGVGIEIHEAPAFSPACKTITKPGMVITVEPGIYLAGEFGVRIEDMVCVTETGCENLTHSPKELIIL